MSYFNKTIECMSFEDKKQLLSKNLIDVVRRVYNNVLPYKEKMDEIGLKPSDIKGIDDISKLPFTLKSDLRNNYPFGMFAVPQDEIIRLHASSGTTGKLTVVGYTKNDIENWSESCARGLYGIGVRKGSVIHIAYGYGLFTGGLGLHYGAEYMGATAVPVSSGNTARQLMLLKDFKAEVLCCTPSYALHLIDEMKKTGYSKDDLSLKYGVFGAESWTNEMRNTIEKELGIKAYDIYGLSEISGPGVAMECEFQNGCHVQDDMFYPEIIDPITLKPLPVGEEGELVFTTLTKEGIPLIRYRTRDLCRILPDRCECGRTTLRLDKIKGRTDDMLIIRGVNVFPSQIESCILKCDDRISPHFHITVDRHNNLDRLTVEVELAPEIAFDEIQLIQALTQKLDSDISSAIGIRAKIMLVSNGSIKRSEGKAVRVTDNRK
ncbi:MAG: phenylacetate--CoA ligase family protein [Christensenellales bacterium]|jgi:phenylacetate-CoA ligase|nr:phenylacetate--CoA ligase [Clostridiales bacterium]